MIKIKAWRKHKRQPSLSVEQNELLSLLAIAFLDMMNGDEGFADSQQADDLLWKMLLTLPSPLLPSGSKRQLVALPMMGQGLQGWTVAGGHVLQEVMLGDNLAHLESALSLLHYVHELQTQLGN